MLLRNIWAYTRERRAGDVSMPLVSSLDGAAQSNTSHAARDWQPAALSSIQQTHRQPYFSLFYLNGVKHLHKWEASQYMYWQKVLSFFFFKFSCKRKKSWFLSLNRFCTFCEICSESRTEVRMRPRTSPAHLPRNKQQNSQIKPTGWDAPAPTPNTPQSPPAAVRRFRLKLTAETQQKDQ